MLLMLSGVSREGTSARIIRPREASGVRQHDPTDFYILGFVLRLHGIKPHHMASEYRSLAGQTGPTPLSIPFVN
jgi:hypothetical protein